MKTKPRISSILGASSLNSAVTGIQGFDLSVLRLEATLDFELQENIRLGHLAERVVSESIKASTNYKLLYENVQLIEDKKTVGEIDFIIEDIKAKQVIHMELAYKFYLFDPKLSSEVVNNWIGPNRNDSLKEKLEKLRNKQFPLLHHNCAKSKFSDIALDEVSQALCFLVSLFIPYGYKANFSPVYQTAIKGYYLSFDAFVRLDHTEKNYCLPTKKEWGMPPSENSNWQSFQEIEASLSKGIKEKRAPLCWQKHKDSFEVFFIVWW